MAFVTDGNRPQALWQPPPNACLTASGTAVEIPSLLMHPWGGGTLVTGQSKEASLKTPMMPHHLLGEVARKDFFQQKVPHSYIPQDQCIVGDHFESYVLGEVRTPTHPPPRPPIGGPRHGSPEGGRGGVWKRASNCPPSRKPFSPTPAKPDNSVDHWTVGGCRSQGNANHICRASCSFQAWKRTAQWTGSWSSRTAVCPRSPTDPGP